jgi:CRAL/TRIO domain
MEDLQAALANEDTASEMGDSDMDDGYQSFDDIPRGHQRAEPRRVTGPAAAAEDPSRSGKRTAGGDANDLAAVLGVDMEISGQEREWALALKEHIQEQEDFHGIPLTDFELVQYAIVDGGNLDEALYRIKRMHELRTLYQIEDTAEQGVQCIKDVMKQQPGFLLHIGQCSRHKHFVQVLDFAKFDPQKIYFEKEWKVVLCGMYYALSSLNPTLSAVRNGHVGIMECDGMGWRNISIDFERRLWHDCGSAFPARFHELSWVGTPSVANLFFSLMKHILPPRISNVVHLGVKFDESFEGRLDSLFLQPSAEIANQRQVMTVESFLTQRYHNKKYFRL